MLPDISALPVRVRPLPFETVASYATRLGAANFMPERKWQRALRAVKRASEEDAKNLTLEQVVETLGALRPAHFDFDCDRAATLTTHADGSSCAKCTTGLAERYGCRRCAPGMTVVQLKHDGPRVCRRHRLWIGPGTLPEDQFPVGEEVRRADRAYASLRRRGRLDAHGLAEILGCVNAWANAELAQPPDDSELFVVAVALAKQVFRPSILQEFDDAARAMKDRYAQMSYIVDRAVGGRASTVLADALWAMLRVLRHGPAEARHSFCGPPVPANEAETEWLEELRTCRYPRFQDRHMTQFVYSDRPGTRYDLVRGSSAVQRYICALGHEFSATCSAMANMRTSDGCPYCARRQPLVGFNTLRDTHPEIAAEWHPALNGDRDPAEFISGSKYRATWLCARGHTYESSVSRRVSARYGCRYCANLLVDPEVNSLAVTHPDIAAEWHPTKNGDVTPSDVVAGSNAARWWVCSEGHVFRMTPAYRRRGGRCRPCGRSERANRGSLAETHPHIARQWHPSMNGNLCPRDVLSGSGRRAWFQCEKGHVEERIIFRVTKGLGPPCRKCHVLPTPETGSLAESHPKLAEELHPERNEDITPHNIRADTSVVLWWRCACSFEWRATGRVRVRGQRECPRCRGSRIAAGFTNMRTTHPHLAQQFHPTRNGALSPDVLVAGTNKRLWWRCEVDGYEWRTTGSSRVRGTGCPLCASNYVVPGRTDMETTHPEVASDWDSERNPGTSPSRLLAGTQRRCWWLCPDGHRERESGAARVRRGGCRACRADRGYGAQGKLEP